MNKHDILKIVIETIVELGEDFDNKDLKEPSEKTVLYDKEGTLDSIGLVTLIADLEVRLRKSSGRDIILADEKAMCQRYCPFKDVGNLVDYIDTLLQEKER